MVKAMLFKSNQTVILNKMPKYNFLDKAGRKSAKMAKKKKVLLTRHVTIDAAMVSNSSTCAKRS